jgi:pimeloyl-ACP methyl ester carboxylesterase
MAIELTRDLIPSGVKVLSFEPGKILRIRAPLPIFTGVMFFIFSLTFYLLGAQAVTFVLSAVFGSHLAITIACNAAAIVVCALMNMRGVVLTIFLAEPKYRLSSPVSLVVGKDAPKVEITTTNKAGRWTSALSIAEQQIAINTSEIGAMGAERPFSRFASAFPLQARNDALDKKPEAPRPAPHAPLHSDQPPAELRAGRPHERPLVVLVHGTWGQQSAWAFPDKSHLVQALGSRLSCDVEYRHFAWSGANRTGDRIEAAARLTAMMRSELAEHDRSVFVLAHSHGGNIAIRAIEDLSDAEQRSVQAILMATPFLRSGQRFDVREVYAAMPQFLQQSLPMVCMFGFWIGSFALIGALQRYLPANIRIDLLKGGGEISLWQLPLLLLYFFGPFALSIFLWKKGVQSFNALPKENTGAEQREISRDPSRLLAISYDQDEAFQALSLLINLLGLLHQIAFLVILGIARLASRTKIFDVLWQGPWLVFMFLMLISCFGLAISMILTPFSGLWAPIDSLLQLETRVENLIYPATDIDGRIIFFVLIGIALVVVAIILSMLVIGIVRIGIFTVIGVIDQMRNKESFLNAILGTVAISIVPEGQSATLLLPGRALFNHVKIYDDERAIDRIALLIRETVAKVQVGT